MVGRLAASVACLLAGSVLVPALPADAAPISMTTTATVPPGSPGAVPTRSLVQGPLEDEILSLVNAERAAAKCRPLRLSAQLRTSARRHAIAMGLAGELSHQLRDEAVFSARITAAGYADWELVAENIAQGLVRPETVLTAWRASPSHHHNLVNCALRRAGAGVVRVGDELWWTLDLAD